jgi:hypothetical protein
MLVKDTVLSAPWFEKSLKLYVDAHVSVIGIGAVLVQIDDKNVDHPVGYYSHTLNRFQSNYSTIEKGIGFTFWLATLLKSI